MYPVSQNTLESCPSSRWDFIQGESTLFRGSFNPSKALNGPVCKRRIQKKLLATKQKLEELDTVAAGLGYSSNLVSLVHFTLVDLPNVLRLDFDLFC